MTDLRNAPLAEVDTVISEAIDREVARQANGLELIASENFVSEAVLEAAGSVFTNKYAEGYPNKYSKPNMPTSSRTAARRQTWLSISLRFSMAIKFLA
jgi:hypothetical protein